MSEFTVSSLQVDERAIEWPTLPENQGVQVGPDSAAIAAEMHPELRELFAPDWLTKYSSELNRIGSIASGWDGYDAPPPTESAIADARGFLGRLPLYELQPSRIAPSVDGGIVVSFFRGDIRASFEFLGEEGAVVTVSRPNLPVEIWEPQSCGNLDEDISKVRAAFR